MLSEVPPLLLQAHPEVLTAIGLLDGELMLVLDGSRIITEQGTGAAREFMMGTDSAIGDAKLMRFAELIEQRLGLQYC